MRQKMSKKLKKIDQQIDSINQINLTNKIVEELLSKANPAELFGKDGLFQQCHFQKTMTLRTLQNQQLTLSVDKYYCQKSESVVCKLY
jgi:hypothetical protein